MELSVSRQDLLRTLNSAQGSVERKTSIPILANLLIEAGGTGPSGLGITATDLEVSFRTVCPATVKEAGVCTVPARKLYDYVKLLPDGDVNLKLLENNWIQIRAGRSRTKMVGMASSNFPKLPAFPTNVTRIPVDAIRSMIAKTSFAISTEESRYTLRGALLVITAERLTMVSTDGHRLALVEAKSTLSGVEAEKKLLVPRKGLQELYALLADVEGGEFELGEDENTLFFRFGPTILTCRKLTGTFPNYQAVLPKDLPKVAVVNNRDLTGAIMRVSQFAEERSCSVTFRLENNQLKVSTSSTESGESEETLDVPYTQEPVTVKFNPNYLREYLKVIADSEQVKLCFKDSSSAGEILPVAAGEFSYRHVLMPMR